MPPRWALLGKAVFKGIGASGLLLYFHDSPEHGGGGAGGRGRPMCVEGTQQQQQQEEGFGASRRRRSNEVASGFFGAVGNTPLIELKSLSEATGCRILAKAEHLNPSGSVKDRAVLSIVLDAERKGLLHPGHGVIVEGTGGNTGIGLALAGLARGYRVILTVPDNIAKDKIKMMEAYGAEVVVQPAVPFTDPRHYYHRAAAIAAELQAQQAAERARYQQHHHGTIEGGERTIFFPNQFENLANFRAHHEMTGPEIYRQANGEIDAFVAAAGTGGTLAGCSVFLKSKIPSVQVFLADPPGSSLASYVRTGQLAPTPGSSITEGIGIGRLTSNFMAAAVDGAFTIADQETVDMAYYLLENEGLFVGPSAALNVVGAVKAALAMGPGHTVVTILCDGGERYLSRTYEDAFLEERGLTPTAQKEEAVGRTQLVIDGVVFPSRQRRLSRRREMEEEAAAAAAME